MIDWTFVGALEGRSLSGYVPDGNHSGVTIATGCDLGWLTDHERAQMPNLCPGRFAFYRGMTGDEARIFVKAHPIDISASDADGVDAITFSDDIVNLRATFSRDSKGSFSSLPERARTVMASVAFQYGNLKRKCPQFWARCVARDYAGMVCTLLDFGDAYPTRRHREAEYLSVLLAPAGGQ